MATTGKRPSAWDKELLERLIRTAAHLGPDASSAEVAESLYRTLIERVRGVIYIEVPDESDPLGYRDIYVSPQIETMLGYTPSEWKQGTWAWQEACHPEDRERVLAEWLRSEKAEDLYMVEYRMKTRGGEEIWVQDEAVPVRDDSGVLLYWQGLLTDITERKRAEALK